MIKTSSIYKIVADDHVGEITFEIRTIDKKYANHVFLELTECADVEHAYIMDTTTGGLLCEYNWLDLQIINYE